MVSSPFPAGQAAASGTRGGGEAATTTWQLDLPNEAATQRLAEVLCEELKAGDLVTLSGDLGAGKTTFARSLIRTLAGDAGLEVPSPTFTLMQLYDTARPPVVHADFYRLGGAEELTDLGWEEACEGALVLVEWPQKAEEALSPDRLDVAFHLLPHEHPGRRRVVMTGHGRFAPRLFRLRAIRTLLDAAGWGDAERRHIQGDASYREYERLTRPDGATAVLMISPPRPPGPVLRGTKPYPIAAKLALTVHPFVAVDKGLRALGFSAPDIYAADLDTGLLLLEDLGSEPVIADGAPIPERYREAALLLAKLHGTTLPDVLPVADGIDHVIPPYDLEALLTEVELIIDWYAPHIGGKALSAVARAQFNTLWTRLLADVVTGPSTWTLRDFHSPNLIWLPERQGLARLGVLDFQDTVLGHPAYDLAALLQDARVTVPAELELSLLGAYARARQGQDPDFDVGGFAAAYAVFAAQRGTKLFGTFARLAKRDGKSIYLNHLPRLRTYLVRNLAHPVLSELRLWYETHLPALVADT